MFLCYKKRMLSQTQITEQFGLKSKVFVKRLQCRDLFSTLSVRTGLSSTEVRPAGKAPNVSVNWSCGDGGLEEINTSTGRRKDSGNPSRLCRRSVFPRWQRLQQQVGQNLEGPRSVEAKSVIKFSSCKNNFAHVWKCPSDFVKPCCWKYSCTDFNYTKYFCTLKTWICAIFLNENFFPNLHIKTPACNWFHMNTNNAISWDKSST